MFPPSLIQTQTYMRIHRHVFVHSIKVSCFALISLLLL